MKYVTISLGPPQLAFRCGPHVSQSGARPPPPWLWMMLIMTILATTTAPPHNMMIVIHSFVTTTPITRTHRRCRPSNRSVGCRNSYHENGGGGGSRRRGGGGGRDDDSSNRHHVSSWEEDHDGNIPMASPNVTHDETTTTTTTTTTTVVDDYMVPHQQVLRGGGGGGKLTKEKPNLWTSTTTYWRTMYHTVTSTMIQQPVRLLRTKVSNLLKSKETLEEEEMIRQIRSLKVQSVIVPNTTVLPQDVIDIAAKRTSLLGNPLRTEYVQDFAQSMKRWYVRQGFVLHSVTGATLIPTTATVEIAVQEPIHHTVPIHITWYKEMIIDPDTGNVTTYRQYRDRHVRRRTFGWQEPMDRRDFNVTYVPTGTSGHVRPTKLARALRMIPGQAFQWDATKWELVQQSGLFRKVLQITPRAVVASDDIDDDDDPSNRKNHAVQLHIVATEAPTKHLEYGVGKNLYHSGWEGELDFEHANILGGGETLGINVRRGTTDVHPSMRCRFSTGRLQETGGYDIEAFSEYIGGTQKRKPREQSDVATAATTRSDDGNDESKQTVASGVTTPANSNLDAQFLDRRGATIRIKNPIDPNTIRNSVFSTSMERTLSSSGTYETIGSTTIEVGPFLKELPMNARSNFDLSITTGARFGSKRPKLTSSSKVSEDDENYETNSLIDNDNVMSSASSLTLSSSSNGVTPYATMSATTRQLFPLLSGRNRSRRDRSIATTASSPISNRNNLSISGGSTVSPFDLPQPPQLATANNNGIGRPLILALKHTVIVSSNSIPQHVGKAIATSTNVRGNTVPDQSLTTALRGTTELRVPLHLPSFIPNEKMQQFFQQDANMVVYSDWLLSLNDNNRNDSTTSEGNDSNSMFRRKSCIGIGLRKTIQGIPLQYDVTYSNEGKLKAMFGLGRDFVF